MRDEPWRKPRRMRSLPICLLMSLATVAFAAGKGTVVFPFQFRDLDTASVRILESAVGAQLERSGLVPLDGDALKSALTEKNLGQQYSSCANATCASTIGKSLGVDRGVVGYVTTSGLIYVLNTRMIDIGTGVVMGTSKRTFNAWNSAAFLEVSPKVVDDLMGVNATVPAAEVGKSSQWGWWVAGVAVVAGTATAAYLFLGAATEDSPYKSPDVDPEQPADPDGSVTFTW